MKTLAFALTCIFMISAAEAQDVSVLGFSSYESCLAEKKRLFKISDTYWDRAWDVVAQYGPKFTGDLWRQAGQFRRRANAIKCFVAPNGTANLSSKPYRGATNQLHKFTSKGLKDTDPNVSKYINDRIDNVKKRSIDTLSDFQKTREQAETVGAGKDNTANVAPTTMAAPTFMKAGSVGDEQELDSEIENVRLENERAEREKLDAETQEVGRSRRHREYYCNWACQRELSPGG